jgi:hypothetical protein
MISQLELIHLIGMEINVNGTDFNFTYDINGNLTEFTYDKPIIVGVKPSLTNDQILFYERI